MRRERYTSLSLAHAATPQRLDLFTSARAWLTRLGHERRPDGALGAPTVAARCNRWLVFALAVSACPACQRPANAEEGASLREQGNTNASESTQGSRQNG